MKDILTANQTAKVIGCNPQKVRERLKRGIWSFGTVVRSEETGNKVHSYEINKYKLAGFLGIPADDIDKRLKGQS